MLGPPARTLFPPFPPEGCSGAVPPAAHPPPPPPPLRWACEYQHHESRVLVADLPSRGDFALPRALGADVVEMRVPTHAMLTGPLEAWLEVGEQHGQHFDWPT